MHPFFTRPAHLLSYIGSWLGLSVLASFAVSFPDGPFLDAALIILPSGFLFGFASLSAWNFCRTYPLRETHPLILVVSILASSLLVGSLLGVFIIGAKFIAGDMPAQTGGTFWPFRGAPLLIYITGVILYLLSVLFHYLLIAYEASRDSERRSLEAEIQARSSELKALRAQIDPHFLFNSLHSISALIASDPPRARTMTVQLAEFFRASVAAGRQHVIPLHEEIGLIRMYLDIETVRFGKRLQVTIDTPEPASSIRVPPLILQPLVENAIKHGIAHLVDGGTISLVSRSVDDILSVTVTNPVDSDGRSAAHQGTGFGLQAVRDRLKAIAPGKGHLDARASAGAYEVVISLPVNLT